MITYRIFEVTIEIIDYIEFYYDVEKNIFDSISKIYLNKCFMGALIIEIHSIIKYSSCIIDQTSGNGSINVQFKAKIIHYVPGEILVGCMIIKKTDSSFVCSNQYANIIVNKHKLYSSFKEDNMIMVTVVDAKYSINSNKIKVIAECYTGLPECTKFHVFGQIDRTILPDGIDILAEMRKLQGENWQTFNNIIYKYVKPPILKSMTFDELFNYDDTKTLIIWRDRGLDLSKPEVCFSNTILDDVIKIPITNALIAIISDYHMYINMINEMTKTYTVDVLKQNPNLLKLLKTIKAK